MSLISTGIDVDISVGIGAVGHPLLGRLDAKSLQFSSYLGARPGDTSVLASFCRATHLRQGNIASGGGREEGSLVPRPIASVRREVI